MIYHLLGAIGRAPRFLLPALTLAAILWLTLAPSPVDGLDVPLFEGADKVVHALMFGALAWALTVDRAVHRPRRPAPAPWRAAALAALGSALAGGAIEIAQETMGYGRTGDWLDFAADTAGAALAAPLAVAAVMAWRRHQ